jgi:hypothetical protein
VLSMSAMRRSMASVRRIGIDSPRTGAEIALPRWSSRWSMRARTRPSETAWSGSRRHLHGSSARPDRCCGRNEKNRTANEIRQCLMNFLTVHIRKRMSHTTRSARRCRNLDGSRSGLPPPRVVAFKCKALEQRFSHNRVVLDDSDLSSLTQRQQEPPPS